MSGTDLPNHLSQGPSIDNKDFILSGFSQEEVTSIHRAVTNLTGELDEPGDDASRYLILGNYNDEQKQRLEGVRDLVEYFGTNVSAFLLSDIDAENRTWDNFYIKFLYILTVVEYTILVAEDNDGGHELEVGEVPLPDLYVLKREYGESAIENDLEREKFDAMIAKLFEVMARNDQLYHWQSFHGLARGTESIVEETSSSDSERSDSGDSKGSSRKEAPIEVVETANESGLPSPWTVTTQRSTVKLPDGVEYEIDEFRKDPPDISDFSKASVLEALPDEWTEEDLDIEDIDIPTEFLLREVISNLNEGHTWINYSREMEGDPSISILVQSLTRDLEDGLALEATGRNSAGNHVVKSIENGLTFETAKEYAKEFTEIFEEIYEDTSDSRRAFEMAVETLKSSIDLSG